jgi:hypothetical protein
VGVFEFCDSQLVFLHLLVERQTEVKFLAGEIAGVVVPGVLDLLLQLAGGPAVGFFLVANLGLEAEDGVVVGLDSGVEGSDNVPALP